MGTLSVDIKCYPQQQCMGMLWMVRLMYTSYFLLHNFKDKVWWQKSQALWRNGMHDMVQFTLNVLKSFVHYRIILVQVVHSSQASNQSSIFLLISLLFSLPMSRTEEDQIWPVTKSCRVKEEGRKYQERKGRRKERKKERKEEGTKGRRKERPNLTCNNFLLCQLNQHWDIGGLK